VQTLRDKQKEHIILKKKNQKFLHVLSKRLTNWMWCIHFQVEKIYQHVSKYLTEY